MCSLGCTLWRRFPEHQAIGCRLAGAATEAANPAEPFKLREPFVDRPARDFQHGGQLILRGPNVREVQRENDERVAEARGQLDGRGGSCGLKG